MAQAPAPLLVTCPTGNIGRHLVPHLLDAGASVRLFLRSPDALDDGLRSKVALVQGNLEDPARVQEALQGVQTAFFLAPINFQAASFDAWYRRLGAVFSEALTDAGEIRVVLLSSAGAQRDDLGPASALGQVEQQLEAATASVVHLRVGYFMENLLAYLPTVAQDGVFYGAFAPDTPVPMVATRDIAEVAARWMLDDTWDGHHIAGVHGPAERTMAEVATVLTDVLQRPVRYQQLPPEAIASVLQQMVGATDGTAADYQTMVAGLERLGLDYKTEPRTRETTTRTTLETFAREVFAPALQAQENAGQAAAPA